MTKFYLILIFLFQSIISIRAQNLSYTNWEELYSDDKIRVQIQFSIPAITPCQSNSGNKFRFKYRVSGKFREYPYFINWKLDFNDCRGGLFFKSYSLNVGRGAGTYDITTWKEIVSEDFQFDAAKLVIKHYDEEGSNLEKFGTGKKATRNSIKPVEIIGLKKVRFNQPIQLSVSGGALGLGAEWVWYEQFCGGKEIGRGESLNFTSSNNVSVFVRAEGKYNTTDCISSLVEVDGSSLAPISIEGTDKLCLGSSVTLKVKGGDLGLGGQWVWYEGRCGTKKLGIGNSLTVKPSQTTSYFVRAEGSINFTNCASKMVKVFDLSIAPISIISLSGNKVCEGSSLRLKVEGGKLANDAKWIWYEGSCGNIKKGEGDTATFKAEKTSSYFVRAEGFCPSEICLEKNIVVVPVTPNLTKIVAQTAGLNGESITLTVPDWENNNDQKIFWYKGTCKDKKSFLGWGPSVEIMPKKTVNYYAYGHGRCGTTPCIFKTINPEYKIEPQNNVETEILPWEERKISPSKNSEGNLGLFEGMNFAVAAGGDFRSFVANTQKRDILQNKNIIFQNLLVGVGLYGELRFNPIYTKNFTLGIQLGGAIGKSPYSFGEDYRNINDNQLFEDYTYKRWNYAIEAAMGLEVIKILGTFQRHIQYNDYQGVLQTPGRPDQQILFNNTMLWETVGLGLRAVNQNDNEESEFYDFIYTFSKEQLAYTGGNGLNGIPFGQHGIIINYWKNNHYGLSMDIRLPKPEDKWKDFKLESAFLQFTLKYNLVAFLNKE